MFLFVQIGYRIRKKKMFNCTVGVPSKDIDVNYSWGIISRAPSKDIEAITVRVQQKLV